MDSLKFNTKVNQKQLNQNKQLKIAMDSFVEEEIKLNQESFIQQTLQKLYIILTALVAEKQQFKEIHSSHIKFNNENKKQSVLNNFLSKSLFSSTQTNSDSISELFKQQIIHKSIIEKQKKLKFQSVIAETVNFHKNDETRIFQKIIKHKAQRTQRYVRNSSETNLQLNRRFSQYPTIQDISMINTPNLSPDLINNQLSPLKVFHQKRILNNLLGKQNIQMQRHQKPAKKIQRKGLQSLVRSGFDRNQILDLKYKKVNLIINDQGRNQNKLTYIASKEMGAMKKKWIL